MRQLLFSFFLSFISINSTAAISDISKIFRQTPTLEALNVCFGGGCAEIRLISIDVQEWSKVESIFAIKTNDANLQRQQISNAIDVLDAIVGAKIDTSNDRAGTFIIQFSQVN